MKTTLRMTQYPKNRRLTHTFVTGDISEIFVLLMVAFMLSVSVAENNSQVETGRTSQIDVLMKYPMSKSSMYFQEAVSRGA